MERNHIIGILLIIAVLFLWNQYFFQPEMQEQLRKKQNQDSLSQLQSPKPAAEPAMHTSPVSDTNTANPLNDSLVQIPIKEVVLENELIKVKFSSKGARITEATIKNHYKIHIAKDSSEQKLPLTLLEDLKNEYDLRFKTEAGDVATKNLNFEINQVSSNEIRFTTQLNTGGNIIINYRLLPSDYQLDYSIRTENVKLKEDLIIHWENYLDKLERNTDYEKYASTVYFKEKEENPDYCSCRNDDKIETNDKRVQWVSHSNQFFNSSLISENGFSKGRYETVLLDPKSEDLKKLITDVSIPASELEQKELKLKWYIGPNEFKRLKAFNVELEDIISYGWSIFGSINRYAIRPLFVFLSNFIGNKGFIILLMTLVVKLLVFPLAYKMLHSQAKMTALKPEIEKVRNKHKDDMQKQQMETMKMYNEFGVNPLGGCFPLLLQMPIWIALYRFFPATIEFRQASFLWAADLTSFDEFIHLSFNLPLFGNTLSLFAFLWMISTLIFTYYSAQSMDFSANPAMKYMQYLMPVIFWFMFNKTAAGLTCYMFFSNLLNIGQTILGRSLLFDTDKIRGELELNKTKPRKKGGFRERLETMMKEQQRQALEREKKTKK
ncbi:MAG: membrane protein insertase YidC [Saprospiraceae bacterium]|nr:membrane protein insertase YidC [Saprospiraceae bacterium]HRG68779.1 membrane protein insertase YidC [Saprospiraceae bacterium]